LLVGILLAGYTLADQLLVDPVLTDQTSTGKTKLYFFYGITCPHCQKAETFLDQLKEKYPSLEIISYEVFENPDNAKLFQKLLKDAGQDQAIMVPTIFIADKIIIGYDTYKVIIGYDTDQTTGLEIEEIVKFCIEGQDSSIKMFKLPFLGEFDPQKISLLFLAIIIGVMDGFNPCAMWVLLLLISLLLSVNSRKKMWLVGGTFIAVSGILYFIFMTAWLNLFLFLGYLTVIRILIGLVALAVGVWRARDFFIWKPGICKVGDEASHSKIETKIKKILMPAALPATFLGIVVLAFSVNLVEFFCSAGFPAIYAQVLALQDISAFQKYFYLLVYDLFYMLDDIVIFSLAMITLKRVGFTDKYSRYSALIGGFLLLLLGLALIFKPDLLMFAS